MAGKYIYSHLATYSVLLVPNGRMRHFPLLYKIYMQCVKLYSFAMANINIYTHTHLMCYHSIMHHVSLTQ